VTNDAQGGSGTSHFEIVTQDRIYFLKADDASDMNNWMSAVKRAKATSSVTRAQHDLTDVTKEGWLVKQVRFYQNIRIGFRFRKLK